ncbi:MAG: hypothetical protein KAH57_09110 [Thermoplasmata archaeon]|nr:hypothetical protein [Thermoplasmata archaeon]
MAMEFALSWDSPLHINEKEISSLHLPWTKRSAGDWNTTPISLDISGRERGSDLPRTLPSPSRVPRINPGASPDRM